MLLQPGRAVVQLSEYLHHARGLSALRPGSAWTSLEAVLLVLDLHIASSYAHKAAQAVLSSLHDTCQKVTILVNGSGNEQPLRYARSL